MRFTLLQEDILKERLKKCALMVYGITANDTKKVSYDVVITNNLRIPEFWRLWLYKT